MSKVYAVYFSPAENTGKMVEKAAGAAADVLGLEGFDVIDLRTPAVREQELEFGENDLVIMGTPTYAGRVPNKIMPFFRDMVKGGGAIGASLVTYGGRSFDDSLMELTLLMKENGFHVLGGGAVVCEHSFAGKLAAGRPDAADIEKAEELGRAVAAKWMMEYMDEPNVPGNNPVGPYYVPKGMDGQPAVFLKAKPVTDAEKCSQCGLCAEKCPMGSIDASDCTQVNGICIKCQACIKACPAGAKYFDNEAFLSHKAMLEENFVGKEQKSEVFL